MQVDVRKQRANDRPLWTARSRRPTRHAFHDILLEETLDELQHASIRDPSAHFRKKRRVWNRIEVALQVRVHHPAVTSFQIPAHFAQCILTIQTRSETVASRLELVFEDRFNHQLQCSLNHAVFDSRYTERALSLTFRYVHTPYRLRAVTAFPQGSRQFSE